MRMWISIGHTWESYSIHLGTIHSLQIGEIVFLQKNVWSINLGHWVSAQGVEANISKIEAILNWPILCSIKYFRGFLKLTEYYRRFVINYRLIAASLTSLLRKDAFHWTKEATMAFNPLKQAIVSLSVLALLDFNQLFVIETDASGFRIGVLLSQKQWPIAYFSQSLSNRAWLNFVYERELVAIVLEVQRWRRYLLGKTVTVRTDQRALKHLLEQREIQLEYQKWLIKLLGFDF